MDTATHAEVFTRAQDNRFVYAIHRNDHTDVFHLEEDTALEHREYTKTHLRCPVTTCPHPNLTTVHRAARRDGFRHLSTDRSVEHSPESLMHHQGKAAIAQWLTTNYGKYLDVEVEAHLPGGERRPDVMATSRTTGTKVVFEVQYSYEPPHVWQARHDWYAAHNIVDVWLFGHTGSHMRALLDGEVQLNPTQQAVRAAGMPVLWFNPFEHAVATAITTQEEPPPRHRREHKVPADRIGDLVVTALSDAWLTERGLRTRDVDEAEANAAALAPLWDAYREKQASVVPPRPPVIVAPAAPPPPPALSDAEKESRRALRRRRQQAREAHAEVVATSRALEGFQRRWRADPTLQRVISALGEEPPILHAPSLLDPVTLGFAHEHWRTVVIADVLLPGQIGQQVSIAAVLSTLNAHAMTFPHGAMTTEVLDWLDHLQYREVVTVSSDRQTFTITGPVPTGRPHTSTAAPAPEARCIACGLPLAEILVEQGYRYHQVPGCANRVARLRSASRY
jgi:hypothetical protein